jgi:hypothetical protein
MAGERWRGIAAGQRGLITRAQLAAAGVDRWMVAHRIATDRWVELAPTVIATTTGELSRAQLMWLGVLAGGPEAIVGDLTAAEVRGLHNWHRDEVTILLPKSRVLVPEPRGIRFRETRRPLRLFRGTVAGLPTCLIEPALLHFAAYQRSTRTAEGVIAAAVQQRLTTPGELAAWIERMKPLRWSKRFQRAVSEIEGGAQSVSEMDVRRMCRGHSLPPPARQTKRRDASGRVRYTDCEWVLADGRVVVLEVDGGFHMEVEHWEDDLARQRALTTPNRLVVRCTSRELRDDPGAVARDLRNLGVGSSESA